jgi:hypothetical protein
MGGRKIRMDVQGVPFFYQISASGVPTLLSEDSPHTFSTSTTNVYLDPWIIGGRFQAFGGLFQKYRVLSGRVSWRPSISFGATSGSEIVNLAMGWLPDPGSTVPAAFTDAPRAGGIVTLANKPASFAIGRSPWLTTDPSSTTPTNIDLRQCSFGLLYCMVDSPSSGSIIDLGYFMFDLEVEFLGARDGALASFASNALAQFRECATERMQRPSSQVDEKKQSKEDDSPVLVKGALSMRDFKLRSSKK